MSNVPAIAKTTPAAKYDIQVATQISRAERRVHLLDLATGLLFFAALSLGFALLMVLLHWKLQLSVGLRQIALVVYLLGGGAFLTWKVLLPLRRPINPRFAALQLERTLPGSKNSVVNYIDLRNENLPTAIRGALGRRAAKDAVQADVEQAIPGKKAGLAGGIAAGVAVVCFALMFTVGFRDFFRLLGGIIAPLNPTTVVAVGQQNRVTVRQPEGGNATVPAGSAIAFTVRVEGDLLPDETPKLILTYPQSKDSVTRPLMRPKRPGGDWTADVSALEVRDGFTYKVTAGDAESPEYRVSVSFTPVVTRFQAVYHYRPYLGLPSMKVQIDNRRLQAWRGSAVELRVQTNGPVKDAMIELTGKDGVRKSLDAAITAESDAFEARIDAADFEKFSHYRMRFTSTRGESYSDPLAYELIADPDKPPHKVDLTKPGFDIRLPANGVLKVEGTSEDDIGVKSLSLRMQIVGGAKLKDKPYRSDKELALPGGGYLKTLAYKDAVDLKAVQGEDGKPVALKEGMELEYWLEARDACDYPGPNPPTESKHFRVILTAPEQDPQKQKQDRDDAQKEKKDHEADQDKQKRNEDQKRKDDQQRAEAQKNQKAGEDDQPKQKPDDKKGEDGTGQPKPLDENRQNEQNGLDKAREEAERRSEEAKEGPGAPSEKENPDAKTEPKGAGKDDKQHPAESKPADPKADGKQPEQQNKKSEGKDAGKENDKKQAGQCKECKNPGGAGGAGKEGGDKEGMGDNKGDGKNGAGTGTGPMGQGDKPAETKEDSAPKPMGPNSQSGGAKGGTPNKGGQASKGKTGPGAQTQPNGQQPQGKDGGEPGEVADKKPAGDAKDQQPGQREAADPTAKDGGDRGMGNPKEQGTAKSDGSGGNGGQREKGDTKSGPKQSSGQSTAKGDTRPKNDGGDMSKIDEKKPSTEDLRNIVKALKNGDEKQVEKALRKLEDIAEKSEDPNAKEAARNLTDDLKKYVEAKQEKEREDAGKPRAGNKPPRTPESPPEEQPALAKGKPSEEQKETAKGKESQGDPMVKRGTEKGPPRKETPPDPKMPPDPENKDPDPTKDAIVKGPKNPLGREAQTEPHNPDEAPLPGKPINPLKQPDTTLTLEKFDREKYRKLQDQIVKSARPPSNETRPATPETQEKLDPNKGGNLPSLSGRKTDPNTTTGENIDTGRVLPPPGYRKTVPEFTKIRAQPEPEKK